MEKDHKIKIAFVLCSLNYGGAERFTLNLIKQLDRRIFDIQLVTIMGGGRLLENFQETGIKIKLFEKKSKLGLSLIFRLWLYFRQEKIQIAHTQLFAGDTWGRVAAIMARVPVIVSTEQNVNLDEGRIKKLVKLFLSRFTDKIIAISGAVRDYQLKTEKISKEKIEIIYNGINPEEFPFIENYQFNSQSPILGIFGRIEPQKGHIILLRALSILKEKYPNIKLLIVGDGSLENKLKKEIKRLALVDNIIWQGTANCVYEEFKKIDLLIVPSLWEGQGVIILEALSCGVPTVASQVGGIKEIITDRKNGFLFYSQDYELLANVISRIIESPASLKNIRENGRRIIREKFSMEIIASEYKSLYFKLLGYENPINQ